MYLFETWTLKQTFKQGMDVLERKTLGSNKGNHQSQNTLLLFPATRWASKRGENEHVEYQIKRFDQ